MSSKRIKFVCKLEQKQNDSVHIIRNVVSEDQEILAKAMLDAYMGTVDQMEDTFDEALTEVRNILNGGYGQFMAKASFLIEQNDEVASVILVNLYDGKPLITEIFTGKMYYRQGMAGVLIRASMNVLFEMSYEELVLNVMPENTGAIKLYEGLGFRV